MKKIMLAIVAIMLVGCGEDSVVLPDNKPDIDKNAAEIALLQASDELQNLRLDTLESRVDSLETRMADAEDAIDANEEKISELCDAVEILDGELSDLRSEFRSEVRELRRADRANRRLIRSKVRNLRQRLLREVRQRQLADANLQGQIDDIEEDLEAFEARQAVINRVLGAGLLFTNLRISQLQSFINYSLRGLDRRLDRVEDDIDDIEGEIATMQANIISLQSQIDNVESRLVSVVYPCGEGNSEEVLLQTQDGLVAYFQEMRTKTISITDSFTIDEYVIPAHSDKFCVDTNFLNGECNEFNYRHVGGATIPSQTYSVGDTAQVKELKKAYLDVLRDGNYRTTDGYSCNFSIVNGEVVND